MLDVAAEWKEERARLQPSAAAFSGDAASRQQSEDTLATLQDTAAATRAMVQEELPFLMRRQVALDWLVGEIERELGCDALVPNRRQEHEVAWAELEAIAVMLSGEGGEQRRSLDEPEEWELDDLWDEVVAE